MEIPLSRFRDTTLDQIQTTFSFPSIVLQPKKIPLFSGGKFSFISIKKRTPLSLIQSSSVKQELQPRPKPKPKPQRRVEVEPPPAEPQISKPSSGLCIEIEKRVVCRRYEDALELFEIVECEGDYEVGESTYDALVKACIELKSIRGVKRVYSHMLRNGFEPDQYMANRVLLMHVKCRMMIDARTLFEEMPERNVVSWNTIIGGLVDGGEFEEACGLFLGMWREFSDASSRTMVTMIRACAGLGDLYVGRQLHTCVVKMGIDKETFLSCGLINMYSKCGNLKDARHVFDEMPNKTVVGWNTIITGYTLHGYSEEALSLYYQMQDSGVKMDHFTYSIIISVCTRLASLERVKQAHAGLVRHGYGADIEANTALVDFYGKWGSIKDARLVFDKMPRKNVTSWNAMIAGYGNHGRGIEAVKMFDHMLCQRVAPNHVTFLAVLSACANSGLSDIGWEIFESMRRNFNSKPRAMHYACMIQLLGREGHLDEALALIRDAPFRPTENMWAALLNACRVHNNFELGKFAAERLYGMEPGKLNNYMVLLNVYTSSGRLEEAAAVVQTLRRKGLRMLPACSWVEINQQAHCFNFGDKSHVQTKEIYQKVDRLMQEIRKHGYIPEDKPLLSDVDKRDEEILFYHSEKLAVSFGLISTSEKTSLRVVQGHRMCDDCHNMIKLIAEVTGREIVVRDATRFHHFKDGTCSCGNYW